MKEIKFYLLVLTAAQFFIVNLFSQSVAINTDGSVANGSAILDIKSINKGLLMPRMTSLQRNAIVTPANGLLVFDISTNSPWFYNGTTWSNLASIGASGWLLNGNSGTNPATHFIGTADAQPLRLRVNNLWAGEIHPSNGNIFLGMGAGQTNTTGNGNTAFGYQSLYLNNTGNNNTSIGLQALAINTTASGNTAIGGGSLFNQSFNNASSAWVSGNTAVGFGTLHFNNPTSVSNGTYNTAVGHSALYSNLTGYANTALGVAALTSNLNGNNNVAVGDSSLYSQNGAATNVAVGTHALFSNTNGTANTAVGPYSLFNNETGGYNTALGVNTLSNNISGSENVALGSRALQFNTGNYNTATGASALRFNSTGFYNTANGFKALNVNTSGSGNAATGYFALSANSSGWYNTATGYAALLTNSTGMSNTATGASALQLNTLGAYNSAYGSNALQLNIDGDYNSATGYQALFRNATGDYNTAIGALALTNLTSGFDNIAIGANSGTAAGNPVCYNSISIGNNGWLNGAPDQVFIGNDNSSWIGGWKPWSVYSDVRLKKNIAGDVPGLTFIKKLRAVTYELLPEEELILLTGNSLPSDIMKRPAAVKPLRQTGFIAQEVEAAAQEAGYSFSGISKVTSGKELYSLSYESFVVPLVKAVQEQQVMIEALQNSLALPRIAENVQVEQQQTVIAQLQQQVALLEKRLAVLEVKK